MPLRAASKFTGGVYATLGVVEQDTINENGDIVTKKRLVHNMSKEGKISKFSANSRTIINYVTNTIVDVHIHPR